jgi:hypothetical protein
MRLNDESAERSLQMMIINNATSPSKLLVWVGLRRSLYEHLYISSSTAKVD